MNQHTEIVLLSPSQLENLITQVVERVQNQAKPEKEEKYLSTKEVQELLKISRSTLHSYIKQGKLRPIRIRRKLLFKKSDLI